MKKNRISAVLLILLGSSVAQVCSAEEAPAPGNDCARAPIENHSLCMDAACAVRAKAELERTLACHKTKMAELAARAAMPGPDSLGGSK